MFKLSTYGTTYTPYSQDSISKSSQKSLVAKTD
ncbi:MAG: hypothetical protein JWQ87_4799 [Candidatus Sulfotelmatobacter sp.]|nr:hypothetical protein [Candidatus Sulfotelmatobacter sp.]